jgi:3-hydroxyacyl-CoA dehydrogenase
VGDRVNQAARTARSVTSEQIEGICILRLAAPSGRLEAGSLAALDEAVSTALAEPSCRALVLAPRGADLCTGAADDLPAPGPEPAPPPVTMAALDALCDRIASAGKPVVAVLRGRCASAGLALALAASARVAVPGAVIDFPELRMARLPPGSGAVRMAWLLGAEGVAFLSAARAARVERFAALAVPAGADADGAEPGLDAAMALARTLADTAPETGSDLPGLADRAALWGAIAQARANLPTPLPAARAHERDLSDALEAAVLLPPAQAMAFARARAADCAERPQARALQHLARALRRAPVITQASEDATATPREGVIVAALSPELAANIVPPLLIGGQRVVAFQPGDGPLDTMLETVALALDALVSARQLDETTAEAAWSRLRGQTALPPSDSVSVILCEPGQEAPFASVLPDDVAVLIWGRATPAPRSPVLLPAPLRGKDGLARLVECLTAPGTPPALARAARDLVLALRLTPLRAQGAPLIAPMLASAQKAAQVLLAHGLSEEEVIATAPLPRAALFAQAPTPPNARPARAGTLPDAPDRLLVLALIAEGMRLLEAGHALRPSDLDLAMVQGAGYPATRGGPFAEADTMGPLVLRSALLRAAPLDPVWAPAPLLDEVIRNGWRFEDLNS